MKVKDFKKFGCKESFNGNCKFKTGDAVINKETKQIGVVVEIYEDGTFQTDRFNGCNSKCELATDQQLKENRKELIADLTIF